MNTICRIASLGIGVFLAVNCAAAADTRAPVEYFSAGPGAAYSSAVRVGDILYLSGQIGIRPDGSVPDGIEAQTRLAMENLSATLKSVGSNMDAVFKCTAMLEDMSTWADFNKVYVTFFKPDRLPARSSFGTDGLALGVLVEVVCLAHSPTSSESG